MNKDNKYINIKDVAEAKGLTSTRSLRFELNKIESKYISREIKVNGGTSYEILFSSLEPEIQKKLREAENNTTALVPNNYKEPDFVSDKTKLTANYRANIVVALQKLRKKYPTKKEADTTFLELYNSGLYLPKAYNFIGSISIGTLHRWVRAFEKHESTECLQPKYKWSKQGEYNSILNDEMRNILLTLLLHPSKYNYGKAIKLTKEILRKRGYEELPCDLSFKRFAENFRKNNYAEWILRREGMKAYHDKVEPYIERDISKIEVGDILVADGHVLNFQVINPFTGKPTRATLVGFLDWKSTALVEKKTGKYKSFPINSKLKPMFEEYTKGKRSDEALFKTRFQNRMDRFTAYRIIRKSCKLAGLPEKVGTHTMRKTFGYHHYQKFKDVAILQKIFNHSSPQVTLRYIGIEQDQIDESYTNFVL